MGSFLVRIKNVDVYIGGNQALKSLSWTMNEGENWAVVGNNGSGKTTLMKLVFGELIPVYGGQVHWFGKREHTPLLEVREKLGYVSAEYQDNYDRPALGWEVVASGFFSSIGLHESVTSEPFVPAWHPHEQWNPDLLLEEAVAMREVGASFEEGLAVIRGDDDDGLFVDARLLQVFEKDPELRVDEADRRVVSGDQVVEIAEQPERQMPV